MTCHINKVIPMEDYCLEIQMDNGSSVILDLKSRLKTMRFGMLSDSELFRCATTDGTYIRWNNKVEISVSEVFQLAQKRKEQMPIQGGDYFNEKDDFGKRKE